jgi:cell wall assembly regulator SMI1
MIYWRRVKDKEIISTGDIEPNASDEKSIMPNITRITENHCEYQSIK